MHAAALVWYCMQLCVLRLCNLVVPPCSILPCTPYAISRAHLPSCHSARESEGYVLKEGEVRLTDEERRTLQERVKERTMEVAWALTKRSIETTARSTVDQILKRGFVSQGASGGGIGSSDGTAGGSGDAGSGAEPSDPSSSGDGPSDVSDPSPSAVSAAEFQARGDALVLIGGIFANEKAVKHAAVGVAVEKLEKLATHAEMARDTVNQAGSLARSMLGDWMAKRGVGQSAIEGGSSSSGMSPTAVAAGGGGADMGADTNAPSSRAPPPANLGAFFREFVKQSQ